MKYVPIFRAVLPFKNKMVELQENDEVTCTRDQRGLEGKEAKETLHILKLMEKQK